LFENFQHVQIGHANVKTEKFNVKANYAIFLCCWLYENVNIRYVTTFDNNQDKRLIYVSLCD